MMDKKLFLQILAACVVAGILGPIFQPGIQSFFDGLVESGVGEGWILLGIFAVLAAAGKLVRMNRKRATEGAES